MTVHRSRFTVHRFRRPFALRTAAQPTVNGEPRTVNPKRTGPLGRLKPERPAFPVWLRCLRVIPALARYVRWDPRTEWIGGGPVPY
jgi:hypothetical protein